MRGKGFPSFRDCPFAMDIVPLLPRMTSYILRTLRNTVSAWFEGYWGDVGVQSDRAETRKPLVGPKYKTDAALIGPFVSCADII